MEKYTKKELDEINRNRLKLPKESDGGLQGQNDVGHQYIIGNIMFDLYDKKGIKSYPEFKIELEEANENGKKRYVIPDIVVKKEEKGIVFVEICKTEMVQNDITKLKRIMRQYTVPNEGFVFDYKKKIWYSVNVEKGSKRIVSSHSEILDYDFPQ